VSKPTTRVTLFGALEITHPPAAPLRPPTQRVLALLGYLIAHHDVPQSRDKLVDLLWPDLLPRQGRRMLSDTLWRARRMLTPPGQSDTRALAIAGDAVTFRPDMTIWVDLIDFEQHIRRADAVPEAEVEQLRAAVELYRGDFLEDCYDDWALYERERLREQYLSALQRLLDHDRARGAYDVALQSALRLAQADPLREEAHRALMRLYHLLGRTDDAMRAFEHCRTVLESELGVEPEAETLRLRDELGALQQRRASTTTRSEASAGAALLQEVPLVGRADARAEVMEAVEAALLGAGGLVLVAGEAGQGKSRLLREVAAGAEWRGAQVSWGRGREDAQARPFEALHQALLAALTPPRARLFAELLPAQTLGTLLPLLPELADLLPAQTLPARSPGEQPAAQLYAAFTSVLLGLSQIVPQVLILEDLHWFDVATLEALAAMLPALRGARVLLVVSGRADELARRQPVWDTLLRFDRSGLLRRVELRGLSEAEVAELVRRALRLKVAVPRFSTRLAEATGGNPFFILETLRALHEQGTLTRDSQGIWHTPWDEPNTDYRELPLPQGLRQVIDGRVRDLAPHERDALAAAAVLGQSFSPAVLARMTADPSTPLRTGEGRRTKDEGRRTKDERRRTNDEGRTTLRQALRPFDMAQGSQAQEGPQERSSLRTSERRTTDHPGDQPSVVGGQLSSVADHLLSRQFLAEDSTGYRFEHELLREVIYDRLDAATRQSLHLRAAEALEQEHYARVEALAQHLYLAGAWDKARPYLIQAGDRARAVCAYREALRNYDQAIEATERQGVESANVGVLWDIQLKRGAVATPLGDYATAIEAYTEVLHLSEQDAAAWDAAARHGARQSIQIQALNGLCFVYGQRNDYARAQGIIQQAMRLAAESPRLIDRAEVFYQAGRMSFRKDDYAEARRFLEEALGLYDALGLDTERAKCLLQIGFTYLRQDGLTDQVISYFTQSLDVYRQQGDRFGEHSCLGDIAGAYLVGGRLTEVVHTVDQSLSFLRSIGALDDVAACLFMRGEACRRMGRLGEALEALQESLEISTCLNRNAAAVFSQVRIAATLRDLGLYEEALTTLNQTFDTEDRMIKASALLVATDVWQLKGQIDKSWACLAEGLALTRWLGAKASMGVAYRLLAQLRIADAHGHVPIAGEDAPDIETSFARSMRLLQEAHSDDELALSYLAYGRYLIGSERPAEAHAALIQAQNLMSRCGMAIALDSVEQLLGSLVATPATLRPGQRRVTLARRGAPRGRPLRPDEFAEVIWTVDQPEQGAIEQPVNKSAARQEQLLRLCAEASAQGAEPTVGDLAAALGVTSRTVDRDIAALRAAGAKLVTRGGSG
jgi:DNA-binding SARP family transcriptional activator